jgi:hypothetical protein
MSERDDPLVESLRRRKQGNEIAEERYREDERARKQASAEYLTAFKELVDIPRARLATAADKAGMKFVVDDHGDTVMLRLGTSTELQFRIQDLGQRTSELPQGHLNGAVYFGEASTTNDRASLNSCNILRIRPQTDGEPLWKVCRFRISGAVPGERVEARLQLGAAPSIDDTFGVQDIATLYEHAGKAARMMHVVTVDFTDEVTEMIEQIIAKAVR